MKLISSVLLGALLALGGCTTGMFDTRPPCARVTVDKGSAKTEIGTDGIAHKSYEVTIKYNKKFGRAFAIAPDYASPFPLQGSDVVALRLKANGYTLHGTKYGKDCNPTFRVA